MQHLNDFLKRRVIINEVITTRFYECSFNLQCYSAVQITIAHNHSSRTIHRALKDKLIKICGLTQKIDFITYPKEPDSLESVEFKDLAIKPAPDVAISIKLES